MSRTLNFAHRGFSGNYPENTRIAFEKAIETEGCDGIENDVHLTKDGEVVICHDELLDRTCNNMTGKICDYSYEELKRADMSYHFSDRMEAQPMMTLREYLGLLEPTGMMTNIELKTGIIPYTGIEKKVVDLIREFAMTEKIIISSFNHYSVMETKRLCPELRCGFLTEAWIYHPGHYCRELGVEYYHPNFHNDTPEIMGELKEQGIGVNCWTANDEEDIRRQIELGVHAIIGNFPDRVAQIRKEMAV